MQMKKLISFDGSQVFVLHDFIYTLPTPKGKKLKNFGDNEDLYFNAEALFPFSTAELLLAPRELPLEDKFKFKLNLCAVRLSSLRDKGICRRCFIFYSSAT
jgi:hypothetical protein